MGPKAPNPYFYRCKFFPYEKRDLKFDFDGKTRRIFKEAHAVAGASKVLCCHAFCVFLRAAFLNHHVNPHRSDTSVRKTLQNMRLGPPTRFRG